MISAISTIVTASKAISATIVIATLPLSLFVLAFVIGGRRGEPRVGHLRRGTALGALLLPRGAIGLVVGRGGGEPRVGLHGRRTVVAIMIAIAMIPPSSSSPSLHDVPVPRAGLAAPSGVGDGRGFVVVPGAPASSNSASCSSPAAAVVAVVVATAVVAVRILFSLFLGEFGKAFVDDGGRAAVAVAVVARDAIASVAISAISKFLLLRRRRITQHGRPTIHHLGLDAFSFPPLPALLAVLLLALFFFSSFSGSCGCRLGGVALLL
mmetsp:Transcript_9528/g.20608  ORF Transcript_9528/g.20608 Transcript_9528/m.20608 type:complete len:266 (+) Transcript_9528:1254-2051(+)